MALLMIQGWASAKMGRKIRGQEYLHRFLPWLVEQIGMKAIGSTIIEEYAHWDGDAPSAVQFVESPALIPPHTTAVQIVNASAVTVHTYPALENGSAFVQICLDSCLPIPSPDRTRNKILACLEMALDYTFYDDKWGWRGTDK
jgi:S-adenosylmethionine/arginine decarboxylase-like enzyme